MSTPAVPPPASGISAGSSASSVETAAVPDVSAVGAEMADAGPGVVPVTWMRTGPVRQDPGAAPRSSTPRAAPSALLVGGSRGAAHAIAGRPVAKGVGKLCCQAGDHRRTGAILARGTRRHTVSARIFGRGRRYLRPVGSGRRRHRGRWQRRPWGSGCRGFRQRVCRTRSLIHAHGSALGLRRGGAGNGDLVHLPGTRERRRPGGMPIEPFTALGGNGSPLRPLSGSACRVRSRCLRGGQPGGSALVVRRVGSL